MTRRVTDGLIILAMLALAATHLWTQGIGGRKVVRPNQVGGVIRSIAGGDAGSIGGAAMVAREGSTRHDSGSGVTRGGACTHAAGPIVACGK